jgi:uncharacterized protein YkwD
MKKLAFYCLLLTVTSLLMSGRTARITDKVQLTSEELKLYNLITAYRNANGKAPIPLSASLTTVAHLHVKDLEDNHPDTGSCIMHSWSAQGKWQSCCYTADHAQKQCMWNKPREFTSYTGNGYEISAQYSDGIYARQALELWKESTYHNETILNKGAYKVKWNAMGIGIYKKYAVIWFGREIDKEGEPGKPVK